MNKQVIEYDNKGTHNVYKSAKIASQTIGIPYYSFIRRIKNNIPTNGKYYKYDDTIEYMHKQLINCDNCGKQFMCEPWRIRKRKNLFCSKKCEGEFRHNQTQKDLNCICEVCGKKFHRKEFQIKKNNHNYCSPECHAIAKQNYMRGENNHQYGLKGELNASWKSDEKISHYGYKLIRKIDHPFANSDGFVFEHRLVAEKYLLNNDNSVEINGTLYLHPDYIVHNIDFDRLNNDVSNLYIMKRCEHTKFHWKLRIENELKEYCRQNNLDYLNVTKNRNGGFGSTTKGGV